MNDVRMQDVSHVIGTLYEAAHEAKIWPLANCASCSMVRWLVWSLGALMFRRAILIPAQRTRNTCSATLTILAVAMSLANCSDQARLQ